MSDLQINCAVIAMFVMAVALLSISGAIDRLRYALHELNLTMRHIESTLNTWGKK